MSIKYKILVTCNNTKFYLTFSVFQLLFGHQLHIAIPRQMAMLTHNYSIEKYEYEYSTTDKDVNIPERRL